MPIVFRKMQIARGKSELFSLKSKSPRKKRTNGNKRAIV